MKFVADMFIHGNVDWDEAEEACRKWGGLVAGALFGAAWWSWADALVSQHGVEGEESAPFKYAWPGIIATLSLILINMISKDDLQDIVDTGDDDVNVCGKVPCCKWKRLP